MSEIDKTLEWASARAKKSDDLHGRSAFPEDDRDAMIILHDTHCSEKSKLEKVQLEMGKAAKWLEEEITRREGAEARAGELEKELREEKEWVATLKHSTDRIRENLNFALEQTKKELAEIMSVNSEARRWLREKREVLPALSKSETALEQSRLELAMLHSKASEYLKDEMCGSDNAPRSRGYLDLALSGRTDSKAWLAGEIEKRVGAMREQLKEANHRHTFAYNKVGASLENARRGMVAREEIIKRYILSENDGHLPSCPTQHDEAMAICSEACLAIRIAVEYADPAPTNPKGETK